MKESKIGFVIAALLLVKSIFTPISIKNAPMCPYGSQAEAYMKIHPTYTCVDTPELIFNTIKAPLVFPGDPEFKVNMEMRRVGMPPM